MQVAVRAYRGPLSGRMTVLLDNEPNVTVDASSVFDGQSTVVYRSSVLTLGSHTVQLTCTGQIGSLGTGSEISIAGFWIQTALL